MKIRSTAVLFLLFVFFCGTVAAQTARRESCSANSPLNGVYQIDNDRSDELYSVIENASSNVPYSEQQIFFIDLAVRLTPPDMLAIECRGNRVSLGSSRAARVEFTADGVTRVARNPDGRAVRSNIAFERNNLTFVSRGGKDDLSFTFTPIDGGRSLRVTRRISARELNVPVIIQTVYNKIGDRARWDIFDGAQIAQQYRGRDTAPSTVATAVPRTRAPRTGTTEADALRGALDRWIDSTNRRDINGQLSFYMPQLQAFYLARNASLRTVRTEKTRVFAGARSINIRAAEPEIIFQDGGRTAIMRFRKKYSVVNGARNQRGEVVQELRWQRTPSGWKIFSERDIRIIN